jgi:hypothetical protein
VCQVCIFSELVLAAGLNPLKGKGKKRKLDEWAEVAAARASLQGKDTILCLAKAVNMGRLTRDHISLQYIHDCSRNAQYKKTTSWRFCQPVLNMCSAMVKSASGPAALDMARGIVGAEQGTRLTSSALKATNLILPSNETIRYHDKRDDIDKGVLMGLSISRAIAWLKRLMPHYAQIVLTGLE